MSVCSTLVDKNILTVHGGGTVLPSTKYNQRNLQIWTNLFTSLCLLRATSMLWAELFFRKLTTLLRWGHLHVFSVFFHHCKALDDHDKGRHLGFFLKTQDCNRVDRPISSFLQDISVLTTSGGLPTGTVHSPTSIIPFWSLVNGSCGKIFFCIGGTQSYCPVCPVEETPVGWFLFWEGNLKEISASQIHSCGIQTCRPVCSVSFCSVCPVFL